MRSAEAEAKFFGLRLLRPECLRIVGPGETVAVKHSWMRLTPEEYALNEDYLAELLAADVLEPRKARR